MNIESLKIHAWDERRDLLVPGDEATTIDVCARHFISSYRKAIESHGNFCVALSGGSTPKKVYQALTSLPYSEQIDWNKVWLFWSDERSVPPTDSESNYMMAMEAGFSNMPIPKQQIHRMQAEDNIEENALKYDELLRTTLKNIFFDLVILGMGEDGHTASLFPQTEGLKAASQLAIANYVPQKNTWRMTLTFDAINRSQNIVIYVIGASKKQTLVEVFQKDQFDRYPVQQVGTKENRALWIIDEEAASDLFKS